MRPAECHGSILDNSPMVGWQVPHIIDYSNWSALLCPHTLALRWTVRQRSTWRSEDALQASVLLTFPSCLRHKLFFFLLLCTLACEHLRDFPVSTPHFCVGMPGFQMLVELCLAFTGDVNLGHQACTTTAFIKPLSHLPSSTFS